MSHAETIAAAMSSMITEVVLAAMTKIA